MQITQFTKAEATRTRLAAVVALKAAAAELGLEVETGNGKFTDTDFSFKVTFMTADAGRAQFDEYAESFGLYVSDYGSTITVRGKHLTIDGVAPRNYRMPIIATERGTGRQYKLDVATIRRALGRTA